MAAEQPVAADGPLRGPPLNRIVRAHRESQMGDLEKQQYDAHMTEYKVLRSEITVYSQRIDRTVGIYLSALFGLFGYLLRPESQFSFSTYLADVRSSPTLSAALLIIGILNSLLVVRIQSFYLAVLAMSQYTATVTRPKIIQLLGTDLLWWDDPEVTRAKAYWLPVRTVAQSGFAVVAVAISLFILFTTYPSVVSNVWLGCLLVVKLGALVYIGFVTYRIAVAGIKFHETPAWLQQARQEKSEP